jgi:MFS family permease
MATLPTLGRRAAFWTAAAALTHTLWTSAAPALTYPLYAQRWHLTPTVTTGMFAVYPVLVVLTLLLFGNLSDRVGRRAMILAGIASSLGGVLLFAAAPGVAWLYAGRALMGIGVGLSAGPATAALVEFSPPGGQARANVVATAATALGMGLATLVGGALIQYAPWPLRLNFLVLATVLAALLAGAWCLPRQDAAARAAAPPWRPATLAVPRALRRVFAASATAVTAGYALGAEMLSLGAQIARDLVGSANVLVNGAVLALLALAIGVTALAARGMAGPRAVHRGAAAAVAGQVLLTLAAALHSLPLFLLACGLAGGYSLLFLGGLTLINAHAPPQHRAGTLSAVYLVGYLTMGAVALALGVVATHAGLRSALDVGAPALAALAVAASALGWRRPAPAPSRQAEAGT